MGGVIPAFQQKGLATKMAINQETWASDMGYTLIIMKTRNTHRSMLILALNRGFRVSGFTRKQTWKEHRIYLEKVIPSESN